MCTGFSSSGTIVLAAMFSVLMWRQGFGLSTLSVPLARQGAKAVHTLSHGPVLNTQGAKVVHTPSHGPVLNNAERMVPCLCINACRPRGRDRGTMGRVSSQQGFGNRVCTMPISSNTAQDCLLRQFTDRFSAWNLFPKIALFNVQMMVRMSVQLSCSLKRRYQCNLVSPVR